MNTFQTLGESIDVILMLSFGLFFILKATDIVKKDGEEADIAKRTKIIRTLGICLLVGAPLMVISRIID
jgi:hypothetical protein